MGEAAAVHPHFAVRPPGMRRLIDEGWTTHRARRSDAPSGARLRGGCGIVHADAVRALPASDASR